MPVPFFGKEFMFTQPDGTKLRVRGWGNQYHAVFETLEGFTVVKDPVTGFYHYAAVSTDGKRLLPTKALPGTTDPEKIGLTPSFRINREAVKSLALENPGLPRGRCRWEIRRERAKRALREAMASERMLREPLKQHTIGNYLGLCLIIQFPDVPGTISQGEVDAFCNQIGYNGFGNRGSVHDYFLDVSAGRLNYNNIICPYYTTRHPKEYYTSNSIEWGIRAQEMIEEALVHLKGQGFDFSRLTSDDENHLYALNLFYAGPRVNNYREGLWPNQSYLSTPFDLGAGKTAHDYQITEMGDQLSLGTFCHENGHMLCDFPDLYDCGGQSYGVGIYCLMAYGCNQNEKNPVQVCAYLKYRAGWAKNLTRLTGELNCTAPSGENSFFIYPRDASEYFIIENRTKTGRDYALVDSGLAIWHIDEQGDNENEQMTPELHYECSLIQADGKNDLEHGENVGDNNDLFQRGRGDRFAESTNPDSKWWDGTASGIDIYNIGPAGQTITFSVRI